MRNRIIKTIATFFFAGYLPVMPGTWGSLAGVLVYFLVRGNISLFLGTFVALSLSGLLVAGRAEELFGNKDDRRIVIDEVSGLLLLFLMIPPHRPHLVIGFLLYRFFDILKIYPTKKLERLSGSWSIMADDILAAFCAYLTLFWCQILTRFFR